MSWLRSFGNMLIIFSIAFAIVQSGLAYNIIDVVRYQDLDELDLSGVVTNVLSSTGFTSIIPSFLPGMSPTPIEEGYYDIKYMWSYKGSLWTYSASIPKSTYNYYKNLDHRSRDYAKYISDEGSKKYLSGLADTFRDAGSAKGYSASENARNVVAFVQSLPYTSDSVTTGYDEYPRYPVETLVDKGGDCEDSALLTAGILKEMRFGVVLLLLPTHMAVGVVCEEGMTGTYYTYKGSKYYYLETTASGWNIGEIPTEFKNTKVTILPF